MVDMQQFNTWCFFCSNKPIPAELQLRNNGAIVFTPYGNSCEPMGYYDESDDIYGVEIKTATKEEAKHITEILCACHTLVEGDNMESPEDIIKRYNRDPNNILTQIGTKGVVYPDDALMHACRLVHKVYGNQLLENAVCKYYVAHDIYKLHPMDLHPLEDPFVNEYLLTERIRIANVIVNCYAVLEELHMQIIADTKNPSVINGKWNPLVKEELCSRLARKSIDSQKSIPWLSRNGVIRPFRASAVEADALCEWSDGQAICDFKINICDAILELSYMRSQLASHKYGNKVFKLSVYDADNAFFLARYLLAKHLGRDICPSS